MFFESINKDSSWLYPSWLSRFKEFYFKHNVGPLFIILIRNPDVDNIGDAFLINSILRQRRF